MRLGTVLVSLLTVVVTTAAHSNDRGDERLVNQRRIENVQRRAKKSMKGKNSDKMGMKSDKKSAYYYYYDDDKHQYPSPTNQMNPSHSPPAEYFPPRPGKGLSQKKPKDPKGHYYGSRLMNSKSLKGKGKGKGYFTYPPFPLPRPTRAPNAVPTTPAPTPVRPEEGCVSSLAQSIQDQVPQVITRNPPRCCDGSPISAVFVTHAEPDTSTFSGFEPFWDVVYEEVLRTTSASGVCFVMTGYNPAAGTRELSMVLADAIGVASTIPEVPSIMMTDPTTDVVLMQAVRSISSNSLLSSIGVFNAGFNNIVVESIVSGQGRLPFVGYLSDAEFGTEAGRVGLRLLDGTPAVPLCYNARIGVVESIAERCASFYAEVTSNPINPEQGVSCSAESNPRDLANQILAIGANVVWSHVDCCSVVNAAVAIARGQGLSVFLGCQDLDTTDGEIDFITQQPIELQAYQAASWAILPVLQAQQGKDRRREQYFPSLQSLVNTGIFSVILM